MLKKEVDLENSIVFKNLSQRKMNFEQVFDNIINFMKQEPIAKYNLMIGTDSQVHKRNTLFVTGILIHREGKGAWGCIRKYVHPRQILNLHEKISIETSLTEEVAYMLTPDKKEKMVEIVLPYIYKGSSLTIEGHIDIGSDKKNATRFLVREMVSRIESAGLEPKIKPYALVASAYANRYTK